MKKTLSRLSCAFIVFISMFLLCVSAVAETMADNEHALLDRNRDQGIGDKSYAEIITEATADISFEEQEKTVKNIEICAEEYELVYEYYFDDLQTFPKTQYDEIIKKVAE